MLNNIINFNKKKYLNIRKYGEKIRNEILYILKKRDIVIIDFKNIKCITSAFADEGIAKLVNYISFEKYKNKIKFINCNKNIKSIINFHMQERFKKN